MVRAKYYKNIKDIFIFIKIMFVEDENEDEGIDEEEDDKTQHEYDDAGTLEETDETNEYEDEIDEGNDNFDVELEASMEIVDNSAEEKDNDVSEEFTDIPGIHEIDDNSAEPLEEVCAIHYFYYFCILYYIYI